MQRRCLSAASRALAASACARVPSRLCLPQVYSARQLADCSPNAAPLLVTSNATVSACPSVGVSAWHSGGARGFTVVRRCCASPAPSRVPNALLQTRRSCVTAAAAATPPPPLDSPRSGSATAPASLEELRGTFFTLPTVHRVAALAVAQFQIAAREALSGRQGGVAPPAQQTCMPIMDFVQRVPSSVRDDIFRSQQDAPHWVEASPLLELVDGDGVRVSAAAHAAMPSPQAGAAEAGTASLTYGPLLHVRTAVPPEWVVQVTEDHEQRSPAAVNGDAAEAMAAVLRVCVVRIVDEMEAQLRNSAARYVSPSDPAAAAVVGVKKASELRFYVPLVDVLQRVQQTVMREADVEEAGLSSACVVSLKSVTMKTLEGFVSRHGTLVSVGRRPQTQEKLFGKAQQLPDPTETFLWVVRSSPLPGGKSAATFVALRRPGEAAAPRFRSTHARVTAATLETNYGGWGSKLVVPTKADVYEILKYVPVTWTNFSNVNVPADVRKQHLRTSSTLQWYRRQPYYFELRNLCNTIEIRRSVVLHPEAHGMTAEEAWETLELQLATGEANSLVYLAGDGAPSDEADTLLERAAMRFLLRVTPTYFAPITLIAQRYNKKNLSEATMLALIRRRPQEFEVLTTRYSDTVLVRRRGGADSSRWRGAFLADLERHPEDVRGIMALCGRMCPSWDRPEFVYVRLAQDEQRDVGGFAGMTRILQRHPTIFRCGAHFVARADPSDPLTLQETEPASDDVTARSPNRAENPYISPMDVALIFHYVAPDDEPCTAAYLADCASPAIRCVLPPRIVTLVQQFPRLFACTETEPGVFAIRKLKQREAHKPQTTAPAVGEAAAVPGTAVASTPNGDGAAPADEVRMLEDELAEEEHMSRAEVIAAVLALVPDSGVEAAQLLLWASMGVQRAANEYYGGVVKLAEALPQHFRVVTTTDAKMVYRAES